MFSLITFDAVVSTLIAVIPLVSPAESYTRSWNVPLNVTVGVALIWTGVVTNKFADVVVGATASPYAE